VGRAGGVQGGELRADARGRRVAPGVLGRQAQELDMQRPFPACTSRPAAEAARGGGKGAVKGEGQRGQVSCF